MSILPLSRKGKRTTYSFAIAALLAALFMRPALHLLQLSGNGNEGLPQLEQGHADDVSRLNKTSIDSAVVISPDKATALRQLKQLLAYARQHHLPVSVAGARHSMGGHTIAPNGIYVNMLPFKHMALDTLSNVLTVGAGALWSEVIPYLNQYGRAVAIMQSDNAFSVGGSLSVNCHGWQHNKPPISSSVLSFSLLQADGDLVTCSRQENRELFSLALGGYGLFGIILEVKLQTVPNEIYTYHRLAMQADRYLENYEKFVNQNPNVRMVYGRLNLDREKFLEKAMLNYFAFEAPAPKGFPLINPGFTELKRLIFLGTKKDDYGKKLRWDTEQLFTKVTIGSRHSRNQVMNESPSLYLNQSPGQTDILHEYFIPREGFNLFIQALRQIIPRHQADLLNVTIRNVYEDKDAHLRYARKEVFAFVMFFNQPLTEEAEQDMTQLTRELVAASLRLGGTYYLPYRLHPDGDQLKQAYPMASAFFQKKLVYDPEEVFQNKFYQHYKAAGTKQPVADHL